MKLRNIFWAIMILLWAVIAVNEIFQLRPTNAVAISNLLVFTVFAAIFSFFF